MSVVPYESYRDSGIEWLGEVPTHWVQQPLFALVAERDASNAGMVENNLLSLSYGRIVRKDIANNDGLLPASFETYQIVEPDDIVWRLTDLQNDQRSLRTALVSERGIITSAYLATQPRGVAPAFLSYLLRAYDLTKVFYSMGGGLRQSMKFSDVKRLPVMVPPLHEQLSIVGFLDRETAKIDALIEEQQRLIALLDEKRQTVISQAVTKGLDPHVPMKDSGCEWLGEVPAHWEVKRLKHITSIYCDGPFGSGLKSEHYVDQGVRVIRLQNIRAGSFHDADAAFIDADYFHRSLIHHEVRAGDVLIAGLGDERNRVGRACVAPANIEPALVKADCFRFRLLPTCVPEFAAAQLSAGAPFSAGTLSSGSTRSRIPASTMAERPFASPPLDEQQAIVRFIRGQMRDVGQLTSAAQRAVSLLSERRSALISSAVTGKIDVRGLVEQAKAA